MQSIFRPASGRKTFGEQSEGDRRDGGLKMGWTKPLPSAWPMGIDCLPDLGRGSDVARSDERGMLCGTAVPAVTYDGVGGMRSVPQIFSGMTRLATLLLPLGSAKLARSNLICIS
jgi:hypothetical protein